MLQILSILSWIGSPNVNTEFQYKKENKIYMNPRKNYPKLAIKVVLSRKKTKTKIMVYGIFNKGAKIHPVSKKRKRN